MTSNACPDVTTSGHAQVEDPLTLTDEEKFASLDEGARFEPAEVDAAGEAMCIKPVLVIPRLHLFRPQDGHFLTERGIDHQPYMPAFRHPVTDQRRWIERIRMILIKEVDIGNAVSYTHLTLPTSDLV